MLPSRVIIAAEQERCDEIVRQEWERIVKEYGMLRTGVNRPAEVVVARIINRIRRVET